MTCMTTLLECLKNSFPLNNDESRDAVLFFLDKPSNMRDLLESVGDALLPWLYWYSAGVTRHTAARRECSLVAGLPAWMTFEIRLPTFQVRGI
jgi:hypothetical protein